MPRAAPGPTSSISKARGWLTTAKRSTRGFQLPGGVAQQLLEMARQAGRRLRQEVEVVDALNVFPVPDGDTGSNMLATIQQALREAETATVLKDMAKRLAHGALLGARGNSGVILSQLFRAQEDVLGRRSSGNIRPDEVTTILGQGATLAKAIISNPVQGTMLSVLEATAGLQPGEALKETLDRLLSAAEQAVAATPDQLAILREAQVVDSGAYGLLLVLQGWYEALTGKPAPTISRKLLGVSRAREQVATGTANPAQLVSAPAGDYGFCITLLVDAPAADGEAMRRRLAELGDSVLVAQAGDSVKLHVHAPDPEAVQAYARQLGTIARAEISNIDEQTATIAPIPVIAVAPGEGLAHIFRSFGAAVVSGGAGRNPSAAQLLDARRSRPGPALLLPNNGNILNTARQAAGMDGDLAVVPTSTVPQGIAATLAYNASASLEDNRSRMVTAAQRTQSAELVRAARGAQIGRTSVKSGQLMAFLEGELLGVDDAGIDALARRAAESRPELATIYFGAGTRPGQGEHLAGQLREAMPDLEIEVVRGDQPHSEFILGFE